MNFNQMFAHYLQFHIEQISKDLNSISSGDEMLNLKIFPDFFLIELAECAMKIFESEQSLLELEPPIIIVGDLHGHLLNLYQILKSCDMPNQTRYLFLGDIVDRGDFSIETLSLLYVLKISFPNNVYIIRGNHEFESSCLKGGFFSEVTSIYNNRLIYNAFVKSFEYIPIAAKIGPYICLHGGISPDLKSLKQLSDYRRPLPNYDDSVLCGVMWSDPNENIRSFQSSFRGVGFYFGKKKLEKFLDKNNLKVLIRGHQCVDGYQICLGGRCITVFSASNYCGGAENRSAVLQINPDMSASPMLFPFLKYLKRTNVNMEAYSTLKKQPQVLPSIKTEVSLSKSMNFKGFLNTNYCNMNKSPDWMHSPIFKYRSLGSYSLSTKSFANVNIFKKTDVKASGEAVKK